MGDYLETEAFGVRGYLPSWVPTPAQREFDSAAADLERLVDTLVTERRQSGADGDDLLSTLATAEYPDGSTPSITEIHDQLATFLLAGHETTATALTYACWLLADGEGTQARLQDEVAAICGDRDPTARDLSALPIAEASSREALRLYLPFPFLHRDAHTECRLGNARVSPGMTVQLPMYSIHRDDRWWDLPDSFRPDRWLAADAQDGDGEGRIIDSDDRPDYAYFPFGGGPRHCIGMRFAMMELQLSLATMAQRLTFERVTQSIDPTVRVSLDPGTVETRIRRS